MLRASPGAPTRLVHRGEMTADLTSEDEQQLTRGGAQVQGKRAKS